MRKLCVSLMILLSLSCKAADKLQVAERLQAVESLTAEKIQLLDKLADEMKVSLAEIKTTVEASQQTGDQGTAQAGSVNYASAFGTGAVGTVIVSIVGFVILNLRAGQSAERRDEQSHLREMARIQNRNGKDKA